MRTDVPDQLVQLLHQWIENRSINIALRLSLERCKAELTCWDKQSRYLLFTERAHAVHLMETAIEIVRMNGDELRRCMDNLRNTVN